MAEQVPYQPMGKRKQVSFARMQEILARRSAAVQAPKAQEVPCGTPTVKWKRVGELAIERDDGLFRIEKQNQAGVWVYECFKRAPDWWVRFATAPSADAAKALCVGQPTS